MTPLGWAAVALGALAVAGLVVTLRRLSKVEPDFSPTFPATPAAHAAPDPTPAQDEPRREGE